MQLVCVLEPLAIFRYTPQKGAFRCGGDALRVVFTCGDRLPTPALRSGIRAEEPPGTSTVPPAGPSACALWGTGAYAGVTEVRRVTTLACRTGISITSDKTAGMVLHRTETQWIHRLGWQSMQRCEHGYIGR